MECDVQEPMRRLSKNFSSVLKGALAMAELAETLKAPLVST